MVAESPMVNDTILVRDKNNPKLKVRMPKLLLQILIQELHNNLISTNPSIGMKGARDCKGEVLISNTNF